MTRKEEIKARILEIELTMLPPLCKELLATQTKITDLNKQAVDLREELVTIALKENEGLPTPWEMLLYEDGRGGEIQRRAREKALYKIVHKEYKPYNPHGISDSGYYPDISQRAIQLRIPELDKNETVMPLLQSIQKGIKELLPFIKARAAIGEEALVTGWKEFSIMDNGLGEHGSAKICEKDGTWRVIYMRHHNGAIKLETTNLTEALKYCAIHHWYQNQY